jgi:glycosyltransferase involved in cell wall biosynthesis
MLLSVIIPTYNRSEILKECLEALRHQTLPREDFEVLIVDDGSTDHTKKIVQSFSGRFPHLKYFYQQNQGQGIARNNALKHAKGEIVVFIGDDIIATPDFLQEHLRTHLRSPYENEAVLGFTGWHPKLEVNPFMAWMTSGAALFGRFGGHQFAYDKLQGKTEADFNFFYTSNISLKRSLLEKYPFDPSFSGYGWEDIELGYRLYKNENLRLHYNPKALAYHDHFMTEDSLGKRMSAIGRSAWIFHRKHPELKKVPSPPKYFVFWMLGNPLLLHFFALINRNFYYYALSKKYFLEGLKEGKKENEVFYKRRLMKKIDISK